MSIINGLSNNTNYNNLSASSEESTKKSAASTASQTTTSADSQGLDSYISSEAVSLANYLDKDSENSSSSLYSVLTYGQTGQLGLICNKVTGANGETKQNVTLADYLENNASSTNLYSALTSEQDETEANKTVSLMDYLDK